MESAAVREGKIYVRMHWRTGLRIMTEKVYFEFGFHPTFFTLGIVSELPLLSLNQKVLQVAR